MGGVHFLRVSPSQAMLGHNGSVPQMGMAPGGLVPVWTLREVLDNSGLCLSKMHIHVRAFPDSLPQAYWQRPWPRSPYS